jgi:hypothetical protein
MMENLATVLPRIPTPRPTTPEMPNSVPKSLESSAKSILSRRSSGLFFPPFLLPASALGAWVRVADATVSARALTRGFHRQSIGQSSSQSSPDPPPEPPEPPEPPPDPLLLLKLPPPPLPKQVAGCDALGGAPGDDRGPRGDAAGK